MGVGLAIFVFDIPVHATTLPELHAVSTRINQVVTKSSPPPQLYFYLAKDPDISWQLRSQLLFYTDAEVVGVVHRRLDDIGSGNFVMARSEHQDTVEKHLPTHELLSNGKRYFIYRVL